MTKNRLTCLRVDEVSTVDKAANGKKFLILKRADPEPTPRETVAKASILGWVAAALKKAAGNSGPTTEVDEMTAEEIKKAIADGAAEALAPMDERIKKLEASLAAPAAAAEGGEGGTQVTKAEGSQVADGTTTTLTEATLSAEQITKMVTDGVAAAIKPLADRIEKIEDASGERQSVLDEHGAHKVEKSAGGFWEGSGLLI